MNEVFINVKGTEIEDLFEKDLVSIDDLVSIIIDLQSDKKILEEEFENFKQNVKDNYKQTSVSEQVGIYDEDFI